MIQICQVYTAITKPHGAAYDNQNPYVDKLITFYGNTRIHAINESTSYTTKQHKEYVYANPIPISATYTRVN